MVMYRTSLKFFLAESTRLHDAPVEFGFTAGRRG
jgi:hypothetical protein